MTEAATTISVLLDENVEKQVLAYLRAEGHDGNHVVDVLEQGVDDDADIAPFARDHDDIIVTRDADFLAMDDGAHSGVFFIENHTLTAYDVSTAILRVVDSVPDRSYLRGVVYLDSWL